MLLVDYREGSADLLDPLLEMGLPAGEDDIDADLEFEGRGEQGAPVRVGIEFKKIGELVGSLKSGRLPGHQLLKMQKYDFRYLIYEGPVRYDSQGRLLEQRKSRWKAGGDWEPMRGGMHVAEFRKRLEVLRLCGGLSHINTADRRDTLKWIETLYRLWTDTDLDKHKSHLVIYQPQPLRPVSQFRQTVASLPNIGFRVSAAVERFFGGSLRRAFTASAADWASIEVPDDSGGKRRFGTKHAAKIMEVID